MAEPLPAALKIPEVSRFISRANQLRSIKPALAYWCEYHAVNQIVGKALHTTDDASFAFTSTLIERLEATKAERADDDAIVDNDAGQAYVEQFAQETFGRAERTMAADKVTRQTADTFDAAATFFDLTREWSEPDAETLQKIKFAKWNAARILKAIRQGEDPNASNPRPQQPEPEEGDAEATPPPPLDANDPEVRELTGFGATAPPPDASLPVDDGPPPMPPQTHAGYFPPTVETPPGEPYTSADAAAPEPFVPSPMSQSPAPSMPGMPPPTTTNPPQASSPATQIPPQPSPQIPTKLPSQFAPPPPQAAPSPGLNPSGPPSWTNTPTIPPPGPSNPPPVLPLHGSATHAAAPPPVAQPVQRMAGSSYTQDQKAINTAQRHAKFAISALNFDDVPTAVAELQNALAMLGGR